MLACRPPVLQTSVVLTGIGRFHVYHWAQVPCFPSACDPLKGPLPPPPLESFYMTCIFKGKMLLKPSVPPAGWYHLSSVLSEQPLVACPGSARPVCPPLPGDHTSEPGHILLSNISKRERTAPPLSLGSALGRPERLHLKCNQCAWQATCFSTAVFVFSMVASVMYLLVVLTLGVRGPGDECGNALGVGSTSVVKLRAPDEVGPQERGYGGSLAGRAAPALAPLRSSGWKNFPDLLTSQPCHSPAAWIRSST